MEQAKARRFGPRPADAVDGRECQACRKPLVEGDYTTLIELGPGDNQESRDRRDRGRAYNAVAIEVHWDCATNEARWHEGGRDEGADNARGFDA